MTEMKADLATCESEFERFAETMDLDVDVSMMDEETKEGFEQQKARVIKAMRSGNLIISESGEPVFTPKHGDNRNPITFAMPTGAALMAMDRKKKGEDVGKMNAMMAQMCGVPANTFAKMAYPDLKVCLALATLFMG